MKKRFMRSGLIQMLLMIAVFVFSLVWLPHILHPKEEIWLVEMEVVSTDREGKTEIVAHGGNLYWLTDLYLDGKAVRNCQVEMMTYEQCRFIVDSHTLMEKKYRTVSVGKEYFGLTKFVSNEIDAVFLSEMEN